MTDDGGSQGAGVTGPPTHGVRLEVVLDPDASVDGRAIYRGRLHEREASRAVVALATRDGVEVTLDPDDEALRKSVTALVRAATKAELVAGDPPPRKIVRWRER
jgi:plasmid stability protein